MKSHLLYFGKTMPWKDNGGQEHPDAFWHLSSFSIDTTNKILYIAFTAYASIADFEAGEESLIKVGGSWSKTYTGDVYDRLIILYAQIVGGVAVATWSIAGAVKDTPNLAGDFESFFEGAGEIISPISLK